MVKFHLNRIYWLIFLIIGVLITSNCKIDIPGLFISTDLNIRLEERDNFRFLNDSDRTRSFGDEYSFIVLVDIHIENEDSRDLEKLGDVIKDSGEEIKFVVIVGDISQYGAAQDIQKFIDIANSLDVPCYPAIGNHDIYFNNWPVWKEKIGSTRYRVDGGGTTLLILDSANTFFGKDQLDWLQSELDNTQGNVFVFSHVNLFAEYPSDVQHFTDTRERARVISILRDKCDAMFMGHIHKRTINEAGNVRYISIEDYRSHRTYCLVSVKKTGIDYQFKKL